MKRYLTILLSLIVVLNCSSSIAFASSPASANEESLNEEAYIDRVHHIMETYEDNPEVAIEELAKLDTAIVQLPVTKNSNTSTHSRRTNPTDYDFTIYCLERGNLNIGYTHYITWTLKSNKAESMPGPLDYISVEWDSDCAEYYTAYGDKNYSSIQGRSTGIVVFNVEDDELTAGKSTTGTVRVTPTKTKKLVFGSKFVHTYNIATVTGGSASVSFKPAAALSAAGDASLGLECNMGFTVNVSNVSEIWQLWTEGSAQVMTQ